MSALRLGRLPDGSRDIRIVDDGAVGRIHMTRYGLRGGGVPVVGGRLPTGESDRDRAARIQRESRHRLREAK